MGLREYVRILRERWLAIVVFGLLGILLAAVVSYATAPSYTATATDFVAIGAPEGANGTLSSGSQFALQRVKSYPQVAVSPDVLRPVIDKLGLDTTLDQLAERVSVDNPADTVLLDVSAKAPTAKDAAELANAVAAQLGVVIQQLETPIGTKLPPIKVSLLNPATPPPTPSEPRTKVNLLVGLLAGLGLGLVWALVRDSLDTTVKDVADVTAVAGASPLGIVGFDPDAARDPLSALSPSSQRSEVFRAIRTNLQYVDVDDQPTVITVTSARPTEGKTTTALNLAIATAQVGQRVCVVETDLRRPKVGEYLGLDESIGLTDVLAGNATLDDALITWRRGLLTVLPAGHVPPNPSELLASHQMVSVLKALRARFDLVLLDATPLLPVTDGAVISSVSDGAVLVVRHGSTTRDQLERAVDALRQVDARLLGAVFNFVPARSGGYSYRYPYGYGGVDAGRPAGRAGNPTTPSAGGEKDADQAPSAAATLPPQVPSP